LNYLLDTNIVSEWVKPRPHAGVIQWLAGVDEDRVYLSVMTFAELWQGICEMSPGPRRNSLKEWVESDLPLRFDGRVFDVTSVVVEVWGSLMAQSQKMGMNLNAMDGFVAATAKVHAITLVTRNVRHFERLDIALANPWIG
jgi:predicted nucleic acid-binding protein